MISKHGNCSNILLESKRKNIEERLVADERDRGFELFTGDEIVNNVKYLGEVVRKERKIVHKLSWAVETFYTTFGVSTSNQ